jgi:hypothetical protein
VAVTTCAEVEFKIGDDDRVDIEEIKNERARTPRFSKYRGTAAEKVSTDQSMAPTRTSG